MTAHPLQFTKANYPLGQSDDERFQGRACAARRRAESHVPILVRLERAPHTQCVVHYLPDEVGFFREVVCHAVDVPGQSDELGNYSTDYG